MDTDRITGAARDMAGRAQAAAGDMLGDARTQAQGAYNQAAGQAEYLAGQVSDLVRDQPIRRRSSRSASGSSSAG